MLLTPKDLSFVGYTYKNFDAVKGGLHGSLGNSFAWISIIPCYLNEQVIGDSSNFEISSNLT